MNKENSPHQPILVVDDEEAILFSIDTILQLAGMDNVIICSDSRQVLPIIERKAPSVILLDLNMPHVDGENILDQVNSLYPDIPVIVITGRIDAESAVECMKNGAFDYLVKPVEESKLISTIEKSLKYTDVQNTNQLVTDPLNPSLEKSLQHPEAFKHIITKSPKMMMLFNYIESVASTDHPVLIKGETGTGKELIARAIHNLSNTTGNFIAVNVAGLDDNVFSDTLFGHIQGAFTGAASNRAGLIEKAANGSLFLDEIGDLSSGSQIKLLRLLQEKEYLPLGSDTNKTSNARVIASTHVDLWELQQKELFRKDLHYRLRTHRITLPPLRDRKVDIPPLINHFAMEAAQSQKKKMPILPKELFFLLETYHFPGNIRELQAMIFDAIAQSKNSTLALTTFREHIARIRQAETRLGENNVQGLPFILADTLPTIKDATQSLIREAMDRAGNNQSIAASMLGISQQALSRRLQKMTT